MMGREGGKEEDGSVVAIEERKNLLEMEEGREGGERGGSVEGLGCGV